MLCHDGADAATPEFGPVPLILRNIARLGEFVKGQLAVAAELGVPALDQYSENGITEANADLYISPDKMHLTRAGYARIAKMQYEFLAKAL